MLFEAELRLAREAALKAGQYLAGLTTREAESSLGRDIKLKADKESEAIILEALRPSSLPVISEETPRLDAAPAGLHWIVDPLDGSYNFFKGLDELCAVSLALWNDNRPMLGVVYKFLTREFYEGRPGRGAFCNGRAVKASTVKTVEEASVATGFSVKGDYSDAGLARSIMLCRKFKKIRMLGAAALMSAYVGLGRIDVYFEKDILLWDIAAGVAIALAGGAVINLTMKDDCKCDLLCCATEELQAEISNYF